MEIRVAGIVKESVVDGPGIRYVIFAQGCKHGCKGCHNPETHDFNGGKLLNADLIVEDIVRNKNIDGVTFSGGDPFFQPEEFCYISKKLKEKGINVIAYTGFTFEDIFRDSRRSKLLKNIDTLIDGSFLLEKKTYKLPFRGSSNQRIINVKQSLLKGIAQEIFI